MFEVQKRLCRTCIYRPDSPLDLKKLEGDIRDPRMAGFFKGFRICHFSRSACCRGFWEKNKNNFTAGQVAQRLGLVRFVEHDIDKREKKRGTRRAVQD